MKTALLVLLMCCVPVGAYPVEQYSRDGRYFRLYNPDPWGGTARCVAHGGGRLNGYYGRATARNGIRTVNHCRGNAGRRKGEYTW